MELVEVIQEKLAEFGLEIIENPHISLTRTVILQYHWIQRFISDVKSNITSIQRFCFSITLISKLIPVHIVKYFISSLYNE